MTKLLSCVKSCALLLAVLTLGGCVVTSLGKLHVINARVDPEGQALELLVARESRYMTEPSVNDVWKTLHYALYAVNLPAADWSADWRSVEGKSRKILSFNGPPPRNVDYHYADGTLFTTNYGPGSALHTVQTTGLQWCAIQPDNTCKAVGEVDLTRSDGRVAHDRDGRHFFAAHQLFASDRAQPLLHVTGRPGYQQFLRERDALDRPMLVERRWLLAASHLSRRPGTPILHIYDLERDTVETVLAQTLALKGLPILVAVDKDEQGWQLLMQFSACKEVDYNKEGGKNSEAGKKVVCDHTYGIQRPGHSQLELLQIPPDRKVDITWRVDFGHWDSRRKRLWLFEAINKYDKARGIEVKAVRY